MCGIIGSVNVEWGKSPLNSIKHRGPDFHSEFVIDNLYMGHTRLSIQDTSAKGNQPMITDDNKLVIIFNGEIYNHIEIRKQLEKDHKIIFKSNSDTETLLYGWYFYGKEILSKLNGIFSFCIYDKSQNKIFLVRDPHGVKPLYIYKYEKKLAFSSELKSFNSMKEFKNDIDLKAVSNYLTFLWSPGDKTMYKYVKKILPNSLIEINLSDLKMKNEKYFHFPNTNQYYNLSEKDWINKLDLCLQKAVKRQLISDVPIGFFLSGGLDSSLIVAIAKKIAPDLKLNCFTIKTNVVDGKEGFTDDLPYARIVAKHLNLNLTEVSPEAEMIENFDSMIYQLDEPQADLAPYNVKIISKMASKLGIKVLIGGVGGDDLFSGYRRHQALLFEKYLKFIPNFFLKLIRNVFYKMKSEKPLVRRLKKISKDWLISKEDRLIGYFNWLPNKNYSNKLFAKKFKNHLKDYDPYDYFYQILAENSNLNQLEKMLRIEQKTFLIDHNLNYSDKMSMEFGIELRVPFLDFDLVNLSHQIPQRLKIKKTITKYLLKKVAERYLPNKLFEKKTGFGSPVRNMIDNEFKPLIKNINDKFIEDQGIFSSYEINKMIEIDKSGKEDFGYNILSLLSIQSWLNQFKHKIVDAI